MVARLTGEVVECETGRLLVNLGFSSGALGFEVQIPKSAAYQSISKGKKVNLEIYTAFREDGVELIGFLTLAEKELFTTLLKVSGIGPKGALSILSVADTQALIRAIADGDREFLTAIPGVGKKTAERILLELGDRLSAMAGATSAGPATSGSSARVWTEARSALSGLGFKETEIDQMFSRLPKSEFEKTEDVVLAALKGSEL